MAGNVIRVGVCERTEREHVFTGNMDWDIVKSGFHHTTGPAGCVCPDHLIQTVTGWRSGYEIRRNDPASEELRIQRNRKWIVAGHAVIRFVGPLNFWLYVL